MFRAPFDVDGYRALKAERDDLLMRLDREQEATKLLRLVYLSEKFGPESKRMISDKIRDFLANKGPDS